MAKSQKELDAELSDRNRYLKGTMGAAEVTVLLEAKASVNATDGDGNTGAHSAAQFGRVDALEALVKGGADVNAKDRWGNTPLHLAAFTGHPKALKVLMDAKADASVRDDINWETPLDIATQEGHKECIALLQVRQCWWSCD